jgi:hypothetical protein
MYGKKGMKISARLLLSAYLLASGSALWATRLQATESAMDMEECTHPSLLHLPPEVLEHVVSYTIGSGQSIDPGALALRETCHALKAIVDDTCQRTFSKSFNLFLPNNDHEALPVLPVTYKKNLIGPILIPLLEQDRCFFVPQNSLLEGELSKDYARINLYPYLQENSAWAEELYEVLFDQVMPTEDLKKKRAVKYLAACLPINHIYGAKEEQNPAHLLDQFKERHGADLKEALKKMKEGTSYFLVGLDENKAKLNDKSHLIVFNQSEVAYLRVLEREGYLPENHPHTLVVNADQEALSFVDPPRYIGRLIVTNGDNQCTSIGDEFLWECTSLNTLDIQGLSNVTLIEGGFLRGCTNLTTVNPQGLSNVTLIKGGFLHECTSLTTFNPQGLSNLTSIGDWFLAECTSLTAFDTQGLSNVTLIEGGFLSGCTNLTSFNPQGLFNVTLIEGGFLRGCTSLTSFDTQGLSNLTSIGNWFLDECTSLTTFNPQGLSNVTSIGDWFLGSCTNLTSFNPQALSNLTSIGDGFLADTPLAGAEMRREILSREHLSKPEDKEHS